MAQNPRPPTPVPFHHLTDADDTPVDMPPELVHELRLKRIENCAKEARTAAVEAKDAVAAHALKDEKSIEAVNGSIQATNGSIQELRGSVDTLKTSLVENLLEALTTRHNADVKNETNKQIVRRSVWGAILQKIGIPIVTFMLGGIAMLAHGC